MEKKRLVVFIPTLSGGGAERVVSRLVCNLDFEKYHVTLLLLKNDISYLIDERIQVNVLGCENLKSALPRFISYLKNNKIDILMSHMSLTNLISILAKLLLRKKFPLIVVEHSTPSIKYKNDKFVRKLIPLLMKCLYRYADRIVCVSKDAMLDLKRLIGDSANRVVHIYNPVVSEDINEQMEKAIRHDWLNNKVDKQLKIIMAIGRLEKVKNFPLLINAFSLAHKEDHSTRLIILGEGSQRNELTQLVNELSLSEVVDLPGHVENPYSYLSKADIFVLSSDLEGLPTVLIEALACGVPVVSTDCPFGPREILEDGAYGELIPVGDREAMKNAILSQLKVTGDKFKLQDRASFFNITRAIEKYNYMLNNL